MNTPWICKLTTVAGLGNETTFQTEEGICLELPQVARRFQLFGAFQSRKGFSEIAGTSLVQEVAQTSAQHLIFRTKSAFYGLELFKPWTPGKKLPTANTSTEVKPLG